MIVESDGFARRSFTRSAISPSLSMERLMYCSRNWANVSSQACISIPLQDPAHLRGERGRIKRLGEHAGNPHVLEFVELRPYRLGGKKNNRNRGCLRILAQGP